MTLQDKVRMVDDILNWFSIEDFNTSVRPLTLGAIRELLHELQDEITSDVDDIISDYIIGITSLLIKHDGDSRCPVWNLESRDNGIEMMAE